MRSKFKFCNRGFKDTMVLIPGWATDYRIFSTLDLNYNYLLPLKYSLFNFSQELLNILDKKAIDKISLFGWSQGGFLASDFAAENPDRADRLILLSICRKFDHQILKEIELKLKQNKRAYLYKFYLECFSGADQESLRWFKQCLLKKYLQQMRLADLLYGLDYLACARINLESLAGIKRIKIFHGADDRIVPLKEANKVKLKLPQADFIALSGIGHISFLHRKFKKEFYY